MLAGDLAAAIEAGERPAIDTPEKLRDWLRANLGVVLPARACCRACHADVQPDAFIFACPACGHADLEILAGWELVLESIEGETAT